MTKLQQLCEIEGMDSLDLLERATGDSVCIGICCNEDCEYTVEVEPDQDKGWCEECKTQTVQSALILAGMI